MILSYHSKALKAKAQKIGFRPSLTIKNLSESVIRMDSILWQGSEGVKAF